MTIYFVARDGFVKIGYTAALDKRLASLNKGSCFAEGMTVGPVELLAHIDGERADEGRLHKRFAADRIPGTEWFYPSDELRRHLCELITRWCGMCWKWVQPQNCGLAMVSGVGLVPIDEISPGEALWPCDCELCPHCEEDLDSCYDDIDADALIERLPMLATRDVQRQLANEQHAYRKELAAEEAAQEARCAEVRARMAVSA